MSRLRLRVTEHDRRDVESELRRRLYAFNVDTTGIDDGRLLVADVVDEAGELVGGLFGWTWGGTAFIDLLFVDAERRGRGLGSRLLAAAEDEARARGCGQLVLATHGFQAPGFYAARGFTEAGRVDDYPRGSAQLYLSKRLS